MALATAAPAGATTVISGPAAVTEGDQATYTITRTCAVIDQPTVTIHVQTGQPGDTATGGADYEPVSQDLAFGCPSLFPQPQPTSRTVTIPTTDDTLHEHNELFTVDISGGDASANQHSVTTQITDNDAPPTVKAGAASAQEGTGADTVLHVPIELSAASGLDVTASYKLTPGTAAAGTDYAAPATGTVTIPAGRTSATVDVTVKGDALDEPDETFTAAVTGVGDADATADSTPATETILDDDPAPTVRVGAASVTEGTGADSVLHVPVTLDAPSGKDVTADYELTAGSASAGADYAAPATGTVQIPAGQTQATVDVAVKGDALHEGTETFTAKLTSAANAAADPAPATETILDDDAAPAVHVGSVTVTEGTGADTVIHVPVTIDAVSGLDVDASYELGGGTATAGDDYAASATGTVHIPAGQTQAGIDVTIKGDATDEPDESFSVTLTGATGATPDGAPATVTIVDDDEPAPPVDNGGGGGGGTGGGDTGGGATGGTGTGGTTPAAQPASAPAQDGLSATGFEDTTAPHATISRLSYRKGRMTVAVSCPRGEPVCRGTLTVFTVPKKGSKVRRLRKELKLGAKVLLIPGGRQARYTIRVSKGNARDLKRGRRVRVRAFAVVHDSAGNVGTVTRNATFKG